MSTITLSFSIPSVKVSSAFLQRLANIVEEEYRARVAEAEKELNNKIARKEQKIRSQPDCTVEEQKTAIQEMRDAERRYGIGRVGNVSYKFEAARGETVTFSSGAEISQAVSMPPNIKSLYVHVSHNDPHFVDITLRFWESLTLGDAELSSDNEDALRGIHARLKQLLESARPAYHRLLMWGPNPLFVRGGVGVFAAWCCLWLVWALALKKSIPHKPSDVPALISLFIFPLLVLSWIWMRLLKYVYPIYEFELGMHDEIRAQVRGFIWVVLGGLFLGVLANVAYGFLLH